MIKRVSAMITAFLSACATTPSSDASVEDEFGNAINEVALETVRQDMPANSLLVGPDWFRQSVDSSTSNEIKSYADDEIIKAWWTDFPIYFSLNKTESRIDVIALDGEPEILRKKANYWLDDFKQRDYEDLADYSTEIKIYPKNGVVARFSLKSDYPRN